MSTNNKKLKNQVKSKIYFFFSLMSFLFLTMLGAEQFPHLILNFDINKTLIATDKTENKSLEDVINEMLSRKYAAHWEESLPEPMTFDAYVRKVLLPGVEHDIQLKEARLVYLTHFIDYLYAHDHSLYPIVLKEFTLIIETLKKAQGNIFPSFYRLIAVLDENQIPYTLFLRSFGKEVFEVKNEINSKLGNVFQVDGKFRKGILSLNNEENIGDSQSIYAFFCSKKHAAIHDDWPYWVAGEMHAHYGKPLYMNPDDPHVLTLFFDDNIKADSVKNIVAPIHFKTGEFISIPHLIASKQLIPVDMLEAILNENYYIECVQEALREHHKRQATMANLSSSVSLASE